jgi:GNAT superfamily N-acetyltransferase
MFSPLNDPALLHAAVDRVRQRAGIRLTRTLFASQAQLTGWASNGELSWQDAGETVLVQRRDCGFSRLYHVAAGIPALEETLAEIQASEPLVVDLVGRPQDLAAVSDAYQAAAFRKHASLIRMARIGNPFPDAPMDTACVEFATVSDLEELHRFFLQLLDPYADQMPTKDDFRIAVEQQSVLTVRQQSGSPLGAALVFERTGLTSMLRYWYVDPALQNRGLGGRLMKRFFSLCTGCGRFLLWVVENNQDSVTKYKHYGFEPDQLTDRILVRRNV